MEDDSIELVASRVGYALMLLGMLVMSAVLVFEALGLVQPTCTEHVAVIRAGERFDCAGGHVVTAPFNGWETSVTARCVCGGPNAGR